MATDEDGNVVADTTYGTWGELEEVSRIEVSTSITVDITSSYTGYNYDDVNDVWNAGERIYDAAMKHYASNETLK